MAEPVKRPKLLRAKAAAKEFGIPYSTLRTMHFRGDIPVLKIGSAWYFDPADIEAFIAKNKQHWS